MPCGRPQKKQQVIVDLRNQRQCAHTQSSSSDETSRSQAPSPNEKHDSMWSSYEDNTKLDPCQSGTEDSDEIEEASEWDELDNEEFAHQVTAMVINDD